MSDPRPALPQAPPPPPPTHPGYATYVVRPGVRFRDRVVAMRGVIAVAVASVIVGGVGGAVLGATTSGGDGGFPGGHVQHRGTFPGGPIGGVNGGAPNQRP